MYNNGQLRLGSLKTLKYKKHKITPLHSKVLDLKIIP